MKVCYETYESFALVLLWNFAKNLYIWQARSTIPISTALRSSALFIVSRREKNDANVPDVNVVAPFHDSINQPEKGKVYDKKPFKFMAEKGRPYMWCSCGQSKTQVSPRNFISLSYDIAVY